MTEDKGDIWTKYRVHPTTDCKVVVAKDKKCKSVWKKENGFWVCVGCNHPSDAHTVSYQKLAHILNLCVDCMEEDNNE